MRMRSHTSKKTFKQVKFLENYDPLLFVEVH